MVLGAPFFGSFDVAARLLLGKVLVEPHFSVWGDVARKVPVAVFRERRWDRNKPNSVTSRVDWFSPFNLLSTSEFGCSFGRGLDGTWSGAGSSRSGSLSRSRYPRRGIGCRRRCRSSSTCKDYISHFVFLRVCSDISICVLLRLDVKVHRPLARQFAVDEDLGPEPHEAGGAAQLGHFLDRVGL